MLHRVLSREDAAEFGATRDHLLRALQERDIDARALWKPMHLQPLYAGCERYGGEVAADLFERGLCLPSSSNLSASDQDLVIETVRIASGQSTRSRAHRPGFQPAR